MYVYPYVLMGVCRCPGRSVRRLSATQEGSRFASSSSSSLQQCSEDRRSLELAQPPDDKVGRWNWRSRKRDEACEVAAHMPLTKQEEGRSDTSDPEGARPVEFCRRLQPAPRGRE